MAMGDKSKYTDKQKRKAEHIAEGYEDSGVSKKEAKSRAWATVNKESGGGKKSGSGRGKKENRSASRKGGKDVLLSHRRYCPVSFLRLFLFSDRYSTDARTPRTNLSEFPCQRAWLWPLRKSRRRPRQTECRGRCC